MASGFHSSPSEKYALCPPCHLAGISLSYSFKKQMHTMVLQCPNTAVSSVPSCLGGKGTWTRVSVWTFLCLHLQLCCCEETRVLCMNLTCRRGHQGFLASQTWRMPGSKLRRAQSPPWTSATPHSYTPWGRVGGVLPGAWPRKGQPRPCLQLSMPRASAAQSRVFLPP